MSIFLALLPIFLSLLKKRYPYLAALLPAKEDEIQKVAVKVAAKKAFAATTVGDAPDELKALFVKFLEDMRDKATNMMLKLVLSLVVRYAPLFLDTVWDELLSKVGQEPDAVTFGAAGDTVSEEAAAFAAAFEDVEQAA